MYHKMMNACEDAINLLIEAQRECEELYIQAPPEVVTEEELREKLDAAATQIDRAVRRLEARDPKRFEIYGA